LEKRNVFPQSHVDFRREAGLSTWVTQEPDWRVKIQRMAAGLAEFPETVILESPEWKLWSRISRWEVIAQKLLEILFDISEAEQPLFMPAATGERVK